MNNYGLFIYSDKVSRRSVYYLFDFCTVSQLGSIHLCGANRAPTGDTGLFCTPSKMNNTQAHKERAIAQFCNASLNFCRRKYADFLINVNLFQAC